MATYTLTIGGVARTVLPGWSFTRPKNAVGTMTCEVLSRDGSYIPALDSEIVLARDGVTLFGGLVIDAPARGAGGPTTPILTRVTAQDFNTYTLRRVISLDLVATTLKANLTTLVAHLAAYGVTLDAGQVTGPSLPALNYSAWVVKDILDDFARLTGFVWDISDTKVLSAIEPGTVSAPFDFVVGNGHIIGDVETRPTRWQYANSIIVLGAGYIGLADNAAAIAANGTWDALINAPDATSQAEVDAIAEGELSARLPTATEAILHTRTHGLYPGMSHTVTVAARQINNTFTIQDVAAQHLGGDIVDYTVTELEGSTSHRGWREGVAGWGGGGTGTTLPGGGGGGGAYQRKTYDLAFGTEFVESAVPTWVDATGHREVSIDTTVRGTTSATIVVMLRALTAGVSVQARLYDVSSGAPCAGTSSVITNTSWERTTFSVTLTAGSKIYKLQLLPGTANEPVSADGYLE